MSLRPEIYGFRIQKMLSLFGAKDEQLVKNLCRELDQTWKLPGPADYTLAYDTLRRAIFDESKELWPDLEMEREPHVCAAVTLAKHDQTWLDVGSGHWKMKAVFALVDEVIGELPVEIQPYLQVFGVGRLLFGPDLTTSWSFYGYLYHDELSALHEALVEFQNQHPEWRGDQFAYGVFDDFVGWLRQIQEKELDLWFYAN
jgi:hypothetical protein